MWLLSVHFLGQCELIIAINISNSNSGDLLYHIIFLFYQTVLPRLQDRCSDVPYWFCILVCAEDCFIMWQLWLEIEREILRGPHQYQSLLVSHATVTLSPLSDMTNILKIFQTKKPRNGETSRRYSLPVGGGLENCLGSSTREEGQSDTSDRYRQSVGIIQKLKLDYWLHQILKGSVLKTSKV